MNDNGRVELLERYARFYGDEHFALAFTAGTTGVDAKRVTTRGWDKTKPLADAEHAAGLVVHRALDRNIAVVLRPSNLVVIECDSEQDLARIEELQLPMTLTVRSSEPYKRHYYFRPPAELETVPYVAFRFESGKLTADGGRYFLAPPSIHPSGVLYAFVHEHGPGEVDIAELPEALYRELSQQARVEASELRTALAVDPDTKVREGNRRETIFRFACMHRRWESDKELILQAALAWNAAHCEPPLTREQVAGQVDGAMKKTGGQELPVIAPVQPVELAGVLKTLRTWLHFPDADLLYLSLAAVLANRMEEGDPVWQMIVGGSSRGKTELLAAFDSLDYVQLVGSLTEAALLSGTPQKERAKDASGGLLRTLPQYGATLVVKDFGAILTLPRDRRAVVVQALRDVYDGRYVRDLGTSGGKHLEWTGRIGLIAGATGALDAHGSVIAALGERWLTLRLAADRKDGESTIADSPTEGDEAAMARRALRGSQTHEMREAISDAVGRYLTALTPPKMRPLDDVDTELLVALSVLVTKARSPVERDPRTREIEIVPQGEGPARFARQLHKLVLCLYALGLARPDVHRAVRRLALDSITPTRRQVLDVLLAVDEPLPTSTVGNAVGLPTNTTRRVLEDLAAHGLVGWRKKHDGDNAPHLWWASATTLDLWRRTANPQKQAESRVPDMSQPYVSRETLDVEEDFSGTRFEGSE